ncbi:Bro-N domain-containing protein [bacterium]|uniref:Bro-N domain-containing protein n=1 Tax=Candidatus Scatenecus faecavium TaxID=2840915 RepID=A0A9D1K337_9BACT|nr:Bro-N domain-containing protein [bacterium]HIS82086.1 Bro-N domain-containing protein [Candidatus Scatenecus faecavium]
MKNEIKIFEQSNIRSSYDEQNEKWYFSIIDIISILTESKNPRRYWSDLKTKLSEEEGFSQLYEKIVQLKLIAPDGKNRQTDCADVETLMRIIQSIPSKKAEPIKQWLAKVGYERMKEISDPSTAIDRARETYKQQGRSDKWIHQRISGQETRGKLTDYWCEHGVEQPGEYAILTNIIHKEWTGLNIKDHKELKGLKYQNLRDHMSEAELLFTALAELSTRQVAENTQATGMKENSKAAKVGGNIAKRAKEDFEERTGQKVVTGENFLPKPQKTKQIKDKRK